MVLPALLCIGLGSGIHEGWLRSRDRVLYYILLTFVVSYTGMRIAAGRVLNERTGHVTCMRTHVRRLLLRALLFFT